MAGIGSFMLYHSITACKLLSIGSELRHLDGIKGNFSIFDDKVYLASAILTESQPVSQLIYSNVKTFVEQQQYLFEIVPYLINKRTKLRQPFLPQRR